MEDALRYWMRRSAEFGDAEAKDTLERWAREEGGKIEVTYDGTFPNACSGVLTILLDGEEIFSSKYSCEVVCQTTLDVNYGYGLRPGNLVWEEQYAKHFSQAVRNAIASRLSQVRVHCGGCR